MAVCEAVGVCVAVSVGGAGVWVAVDGGADGTEVAACGVRQPASRDNRIHSTTHPGRGSLRMGGLYMGNVRRVTLGVTRLTFNFDKSYLATGSSVMLSANLTKSSFPSGYLVKK